MGVRVGLDDRLAMVFAVSAGNWLDWVVVAAVAGGTGEVVEVTPKRRGC